MRRITWYWFIIPELAALLLVGCTQGEPVERVEQKIKQSSVIIQSQKLNGREQHGTGFFIQGTENACAVLTAAHVVASSKDLIPNSDNKTSKALIKINLEIQTYDNKVWPASNVQQLPKLDLAVVTFYIGKRGCPYKSLQFKNFDTIKEGDEAFIAGYPVSKEISLEFEWVPGKIDYIDDRGFEQGYKVAYNARTVGGMSGGAVVTPDGKVIAVHGLGDDKVPRLAALSPGELSQRQQSQVEKAQKRSRGSVVTKFGWGIPVNAYLENLPDISLIPTEPTAADWVNLAYAKYLAGDYFTSLKAFDEAIKIAPKDSGIWYHKAKILFGMKRYKEASFCLRKFLAFDKRLRNNSYSEAQILALLFLLESQQNSGVSQSP